MGLLLRLILPTYFKEPRVVKWWKVLTSRHPYEGLDSWLAMDRAFEVVVKAESPSRESGYPLLLRVRRVIDIFDHAISLMVESGI